MEITPRTLLRAFLVIGGLAIAGMGIADEELWRIALGVAAATLGGFGLWYQYSQEREGSESH